MATESEEMADRALGATWPVTVKLRHPIEFGKTTVTELVFQKGQLGFLKGVTLDGDVPPADQLMLLAARLSGQPLKLIEMLDPDDAEEVLAIALGFRARCLTSGRKPSG